MAINSVQHRYLSNNSTSVPCSIPKDILTLHYMGFKKFLQFDATGPRICVNLRFFLTNAFRIHFILAQCYSYENCSFLHVHVDQPWCQALLKWQFSLTGDV